jgi:hypothetical protein
MCSRVPDVIIDQLDEDLEEDPTLPRTPSDGGEEKLEPEAENGMVVVTL